MIGNVVQGGNRFQCNGSLEPPFLEELITGFRRGQLAWDDGGLVDGTPGLVFWNGDGWIKLVDANLFPTLQQVTDSGNTTDKDILIEASGTTVSKKLQVSTNSGAATVELNAGRELGQDIAAILMNGTDAQLSVPIGVNLRIIDGNADTVLTILADGSGTEDKFGVVHRSGNGNPEGFITGSRGSTWSRVDGNPGETFYIKQSGSGTSGWAPIA